jgi:hypothetical protein
MVTMDYLKSNAQLARERQAEQRADQRQRLNMPSKDTASAPRMEMRMQARIPEPQRQAPAPTRPAAQKPTFKESSYIRGQRMSLTPDENIGSHTPMPRSSYTPEQDASLRGGRFPAAPISEPGISGNWARPKR